MRHKILLVSFDFYPRLGGVARASHQLALALSHNPACQVRVLAPVEKDSQDQTQKLDIQRADMPKNSVLAIPFFCYHLVKQVLDFRPQSLLFILWMPEGLAGLFILPFLKVMGVQYGLMAHGVEMIESRHTFRKKLRACLAPLKTLSFHFAKVVFPVSRFTQEQLTCPPERQVLVYNGVDTDYFKKTTPSERLQRRYGLNGQKILLTITRLEDYKGVDQAIRALAIVRQQYPNFMYLVGGTGPQYQELKKLIAELEMGRHVLLCGRIEEGELVEHYNLAHLNVLLSRYDALTPNFEGFGLVFLEAAACGVPSLGGRSGGIPDAIVDGQTGLLVDPTDLKAISQAFLSLLQDEERLQFLGRKALEHARQNMTWGHMAQRVLGGLLACVAFVVLS